ncbi:30S ribosome-binding factor RbfA [Namhaeicola litoreus]|uniref:Ribosome-binding factor A n=1 Tax=Namhaeicola litoreus TaxID=1052145 RepID=A0ABW3XZX0_9FLAO
MESNRQKKIAGVLQEDLANLLRKEAQDGGKGVLISVTKVKVTADLNEAKVYLSIFPSNLKVDIFKEIVDQSSELRYKMAQLTRNQLRKMPELHFYIDDSLDYIDNIDQALKGGENPIKNPEVLKEKKKK